jgi:hypothetical protein
MPNFSLAFSSALKPIIGLAILEAVWYLIELTPFSFLAGDWLYLVKFALFFWAGWQAVKLGGALIDALAAGALAGLAVEIIDFILSSLLYPGDHSLLYWLENFIIWIVIAAVVAAIAFFIGKKKSAPSAEASEESTE